VKVRAKAIPVPPAEAGVALSCPACNGASFEPFRYELVECGSCGLVIDPAAIRRSREEKVQEDWFGIPDAAQSVWVRTFESWNNARTIARIQRFVKAPARVLEVGVGSGSLLVALRDAGFDAQGCDLSPRVAEYVRTTLGMPMTVGPVESVETTSKFDVVVMNHVVEHTSEPVKMLESVRRLARPGALFHVAVPNIACWEAHLPGWTSYEPYHLVYFTPRTLSAVAERAGLRPLETATFESFSGWFLSVLRSVFARRLRQVDGRETLRTMRRATHVEHLYRTAMVASGAALYPLRLMQARAGAGEEAILLATCA